VPVLLDDDLAKGSGWKREVSASLRFKPFRVVPEDMVILLDYPVGESTKSDSIIVVVVVVVVVCECAALVPHSRRKRGGGGCVRD